MQTPHQHMRGNGCDRCAGIHQLTTEEFIAEARKVHGDKYGYDKTIYINSNTKVQIYCGKCKNYFLQNPILHKNGFGCARCNKTYKYSTEEWVEEVLKKYPQYNLLYDYKDTFYTNATTKVQIYCKKCKEYFYQLPSNHLNHNQGCPKCKGGIKCSNEKFVEKAKKVHGDKYDYSNTVYLNAKEKIIIKCNTCGNVFEQEASSHLQGHGCSFCLNYKLEMEVKEILEKNNIKFEFQKRFEECRDKLPLSFDFYLPEKNILIECQGEQHFQFIKYFHKSLMEFAIQLKHDQIKKEFCLKNNITLLEVQNENIEKSLQARLLDKFE
jgi:disulfide oxidoreductase YuzD